MNSNNQKQERPMSNQEFFSYAGLAGIISASVWLSKNERYIHQFHFENFEKIYLAAWGLCLIPIYFLMRYIKKKTKHLDDRAENLFRRWKKRNNSMIYVGKTTDQVPLYLTEEDRCNHVQVIGSTGRGKTKSVIIPWATRDLLNGYSTVIMDGKGSSEIPDMLKEVAEYKKSFNVFHFDIDDKESIRINPLAYGSTQQVTDRIFKSFEFEDSYYKNVQYDICGQMIQLIKDSGKQLTFKSLYKHLTNDDEVTDSVKFVYDMDLKQKIISFLKQSKKDRDQKLSGLISQLSPFAEGEIAKLVNGCDGGGRGYMLISDFVRNGGFMVENKVCHKGALVISIQSLKYQEIGSRLGKIILQEIAFATALREQEYSKQFLSVFLDEFSEFTYKGFISLLNKARSSKVAIHLCHQSLGDLTSISNDFAKSVNTNTNVKCILGVNDPETADFYARHMGTKTTEKFTEQAESKYFGGVERTGNMSLREVDAYKIHPNLLKSYSHGQGALHLPSKNGSITETIQFAMIDHEFELEVL